MNKRLIAGLAVMAALATTPLALRALAQTPAAPPRVLAPGEERFPELRATQYPLDSLRIGLAIYQSGCQSCHGDDERGTRRGPDLTRSVLLLDDPVGAQLAAYLKAPHGMQSERVAFPQLTDGQLKGVSDFLRAGNQVIASRNYPPPNILVGDAKAGQAYFNGAGGCAGCHSATGDFARIGGKYADPTVLQSYVIAPPRTPPGVAGAPAASATGAVTISKNQFRATVSARGQPPVTGQLVRLTDWDVVIADLNTGERKSWDRIDGRPTVTVTDPLQGHAQVRRTITDRDMNDVTAYLAGLK